MNTTIIHYLLDRRVFQKFGEYLRVNDFENRDDRESFKRLQKFYSKYSSDNPTPELVGLSAPPIIPKGAELIVEDALARVMLTRQVEEKVGVLNNTSLLTLDGLADGVLRESRRVLSAPKESLKPYPVGLPALAERIEGFFPGELIVIASPPYGGKTHWLMYFVKALVRAKLKPLHIFGEDAARSMVKYYQQARVKLTESILWDSSDRPIRLTDIQALADEHKPDAIVVDYADLVLPPAQREFTRTELTDTFRGLRRIASKCGVPLITATQTDAHGFFDELPGLHSLSEAKIGKASVSDVVLMFSQMQAEVPSGRGRLIIAKAKGREVRQRVIPVNVNWDTFEVQSRVRV